MLDTRVLRVAATGSVLSLALGLLVGVTAAPPAAAAGEQITLAKSADATTLPGEPVGYTLTTHNPGTAPEYNLGLRDVLPPGVTYLAGSTTPTGAGEPTVSVTGVAPNTSQVLTWDNVADVQIGSSYRISFRVTPDAATYPAGSTVPNSATAYTNTDPRTAPTFDSGGTVVPGTYTESAASTASTAVQPIRVTKSEPSPEGELLRGLHTQSTVYTLGVTGSAIAATTGVTVADYLPAGLEFLGCGATDNSPPGMLEYPGAPRLTSTPTVPGCVVPDSVSTVTNPVTVPALPAGVYTRLTWNLGTLGAGQTVTLPYRAGIPLRANTTTFTGGTPAGATTQGANLANNNGASTRETSSESSVTNRVVVAGTYTGSYQGSPTPGATPVTVSDALSRQVEDLSMQKSVSPTAFTQGGVATYTLRVRGSEYVRSTGVTLTDVIPDGLCPLTPTVNASPDGAGECDPGAGFAPTISGSPTATIDFASVTHSGTDYTLVFTPFAVPADAVVTVTYQVRMRATYEAGNPTASGDSYTNDVSLTGTTAPAMPGTGESGPQQVGDASSATIASGGGSIDKTLLPATTSPYACNSTGYAQSADLTTAEQTFHVGDRICFTLRVDFPGGSSSRNPVVTDFLPAGTRYEAGSMTPTANNTATVAGFNDAAAAAGTANPTWALGTPTSGSLFVPRGAVFEVRIAVIVTAAAPARVGQIRGNLMKARTENTAGEALSLRDREDVVIAPTPDVGITKGVANVNGGTPNGPDVDDVTVREGDVVTFRVDVSNNGTVATGTAVPVHGVEVWDLLPPGITCASITAISDGGTCRAPGALPVTPGTVSTVSWPALASPLAPGATRTLTYAMTVPTGTGVSANLVDTASVRTFQADANTGQVSTFYPQANVDTTVPAASQTAPVATDPSNVRLPAPVVTKKTQSTSVVESNNDLETQATIGEVVTYRVTATVPAHTTVYRATLTDPMPTGLTLLTAAGTQSLDGGTTTTPLSAAGFTVTSTAASATLTYPSTYQNTTGSDHVFGMDITARITTLASNTHNVTRTNQVTLRSYVAATGATQRPALTASTALQVVVPAPTLAKSVAPGSATSGQTVTFTLTANNASGRPPTHDTVVVDCLPAGLTFLAYGTPSQGSTVAASPGNGANGCATGSTRLQWDVGPIAAGAAKTLTFTATVDPLAAGAAAYTNTATLTGSTLADGTNDCSATSLERCVTATANATVRVAPASVTKTTSTPQRTIGQAAAFTIRATIPANINYYDSAIIDTLPAGLDPASVITTAVTCSPACAVPGTALTQAAGPGGTTLVGWLLGDLTAQPTARTVTVSFTAVVQDVPANNRTTVLTNTANVRWNLVNGADPTSAGATFGAQSANGTATVQVLEPHVTLSKAVSDSTPEPGQTFGYTVTARNTGAANLSPAYQVVVTDTVPAGVVVDPGTITAGGVLSGAGPAGGGTITWTITTLAVGGSVDLHYDATLAASSTLTAAGLTNSVDAQYDGLPTGGRHYDDVTPATATVTPAFPYVTAAKSTVTAGPAYLGQDFVWQLTLTNTGAGVAHRVDAIDTLPHNWSYRPGTATVSVDGGPTAPLTPTVGGAPATGQTLTFADITDLAPGKALVIRVTTRPDAGAVTDPGVGASVAHTNTVGTTAEDATGASGNVSGPYHGPDATASTRIDSADLEVAKTTSTPFVAGSQGSWTLQIVNHGPDTAVGPFTVTDTVPIGVTFVSATGSGWSCSYDNGPRTVTCSRTAAADTLASGSSFPLVTVTVSVAAGTADGTTYTNTATVTAGTYDPVPGNNTDTATATVTTRADLRLVKRLSGTMTAGQDATYTLDVTNLGASDAQATVRVVDTLPTGTTYVSAGGTGWTCSVAGQLLTCDRGALAAGAAAPQLTVVVHVPAGRTADVTNTATVSSPTTDPVPGNNTDTVTTTPLTSADLVLTKTHVGTLTAGEDGTYRFRTENLGSSDAAGPLTLTDTLPAGVGYVSVAVADGWSCSAAGQDLTCTRAAGLAAGAVTTTEVTVHVAADATGNLSNTATVGSPTTDPNPTNNTDGDDSTVTTSADLSITKTAAPRPVTAGTTLTYTLLVANAGPSQATSVVVSDPVPTGLTFGSASGAGWTCSYAPGTRLVGCTRPTVGAGATAPTITVTTTVAPDAGPATLSNTATVTSATPDPRPGDNSDTATVDVVDDANLALTKSRVGGGPVVAGTTTTFTVVVHNDGPSDADTVVVTDTLPTGLLAQGATGAGWSCDVTDSLVTCRRPGIAAGQDAPTITITALVASYVPTGTTLTNTATTTTTTPGDDPADNTDTADVPVTTSADLSLAKSHRGGPAVAGGTVTFDLQVHNDGPSDAIAPVTVVDTLPAGTGFVSASAPWSCATGVDPQQLTCTLTPGGAGVAPGADAPVLTVLVALDPALDPGDLTNSATVDSPTPDPRPGNNTDTDAVQVGALTNLVMGKTHTGPVRVGDPLVFTLTVTNEGLSQARDVVVTDALPTGLTYGSATGAGWTCDYDDPSRHLTCERPTLEPATSRPVSVTVTVTAAAYPSVDNTASVTTSTPETTTDDNSATDTVAVPPLVDLAITKTHTGTPVVGGPVSFTLSVTNNGPTADPGPVTVTDTLPGGLRPTAASGPGWACTVDGRRVSCERAAGLATAESSVIGVHADVLADAYPEVVNSASVTSAAEDTDPANNSATDRVPVEPQVALRIGKTLTSYDDGTAVWRLQVDNLGPNATVDPVVVVDTLPAQLRYVSYRGDGWACAAVVQVVTCTHADTVAAGRSTEVELTTAVSGSEGTVVTNDAEITGGFRHDPDTGNHSDSAELTIGGNGGLPPTGADLTGRALAGLVLLLLGTGLLLATRRRRRTT